MTAAFPFGMHPKAKNLPRWMRGSNGDGRQQITFQTVGQFPVLSEPAQDNAVPNEGLVLFMQFDESLTDDSPAKHSASLLHDKGAGPRYVSGKFGKAIRLYNTDNKPGGEMIRTNSSKEIEALVRGGKMTFSIWAKHATDRHEQAYLGISAIHGGPKHIGSHLYTKIWHDGEIRVLGARQREDIWGIARSPLHAFEVEKWFHLAVTVDGFKVAIFVDGKQIAPPFVAPPSYIQPLNETCELNDLKEPENCKFYIGGRAGEYGGFEGALDQLRVYNRVLTIEEISQLHQESR